MPLDALRSHGFFSEFGSIFGYSAESRHKWKKAGEIFFILCAVRYCGIDAVLLRYARFLSRQL